MVDEKKKYGLRGVMPGIAPETEGAPTGVPGGNDGRDKTRMTGTPVSVAQTPPPVSVDLEGMAPQSAGPDDGANGSPDAGRAREYINGGAPLQGKAQTNDPAAGRTIVRPYKDDTEKNADRDTAADEEKDAVIGYERQIAALRAAARRHAPETEWERRERERKERSWRIIGSVSDGLSALSNLWFTSQYAPDMFDPDKGQLKPLNERIERMKAERDKDADRYLQYALKIGDLHNGRAGTLRALRAQREQQRLAREAAAREAARDKRDRDMHQLKLQVLQGEIDAKAAEAKRKQIEAQYAEALQKAKIAELGAKTAEHKAGVVAKHAAAGASNRANRHRYKYTAFDKHGKPHGFDSEGEANNFAKRENTYVYEVVEETDDVGGGKKKVRSGGYRARGVVNGKMPKVK